MMKRLVFGLLLMLLALPVLAQQPQTPQIAFINADTLQLATNGTVTPLSDAPTYDYTAVWSPDGTLLAYAASAGDNAFSAEKTIFVYDGVTSQAVTTAQFNLGTGLSWTADGRLLYMVDTNEFFPGDQPQAGLRTQMYVVAPQANATPELIMDNVSFGVGCGGGSAIPMDMVYWQETDFGGSRGIVALTDYGIVHSAQCVGDKTSLSRPFSGETIALGNGNIGRAVVSPDRRTVAGIAQTNTETSLTRLLTLVNLETLEIQEISTTDMPDQLAYDRQGNLYYSARVDVGNWLDAFTPEETQKIAAALGFVTDGSQRGLDYLPRYETRIYRIAPDGTETLLYTGAGYAIGRMAVSGMSLYFSEVDSGETWFKAVVSGEVTFDNNFDVYKDYVAVNVFALALADNSVQLVGENYQQFAVQPLQSAAMR